MSISQQSQTDSNSRWMDAPTKSVDVRGTKFIYRELGPDAGLPVIFLNHLAAELDRWDPRVVDGVAAKRRVIVFDNRGVGASEGSTPNSVAAMARDAIACIRALGFEQVDLLGFSLGGFISQVISQEEPQLVRKMILAGTGPAGGVGIDKVTRITIRDMIKGALTFKHPEYYLFFTSTPNGRGAARDFLRRLKERRDNRDKPVSIVAFISQLKAILPGGVKRPPICRVFITRSWWRMAIRTRWCRAAIRSTWRVACRTPSSCSITTPDMAEFSSTTALS